MLNIKYVLATGLLITSLSSSALSAPGQYSIDPAHTSVNFNIDHMGFSKVLGRFNTISGDIIVDTKGSAQLKVNIQTSSVDTNHQKRDEHLRSPDFLNTKQFPKMTFSSQLQMDAADSQATLLGELNMLGIKRPVTLKLQKGKEGKDPWGLHRIGYSAQTVLKRSDFGMDFMQGGVGDDIEINIQLEAVKQ